MPKPRPPLITESYLKRLKQRAKALVKSTKQPLWKAQFDIATREGFPSWKALVRNLGNRPHQDQFVERLPLEVTNKNDRNSCDSDLPVTNPVGAHEAPLKSAALMSENRAVLAQYGIEYSIFEPTETGLKKSIIDATQPVRTHFDLADFHNYELQPQQSKEEDHKVKKQAVFLNSDEVIKSTLSMYRPATKSGDPRMWFRGLGGYALAGDQIAIVIFDGIAYLINLSSVNLKNCLNNENFIGEFLSGYRQGISSISDELLAKLRRIANNPLIAQGAGDSDIGNAVELALGIEQNSSKKPDYKGIEIKSGRRSLNRTSMFAQVPMWSKSSCKSSKEILQRHGYMRGDDLRLYCTVSAKKPNSQGLYFSVPTNADEIVEKHVDHGDVAYWNGSTLRKRMLEKHKETFWIEAASELINGVEHFRLKKIIHTRKPVLSQLLPLISSGVITMDHLIKMKGGTTSAKEKGPLFKIDKRNLSLLFPDPIEYIL